ncbi:MAG: immunoglobulin-like domain-containing protein [Patescibacteria group bacterium]
MGFLNFLKYHNAVPITVSFLLLGAGGVFAATNPEAVYSANQKVVSIDNTYIAIRDLKSFTPKVEITAVTEDADNYYINYRFTTIDLVNAVWQDAIKEKTMTVGKTLLGQYLDLGVYATEQFKQIIDREIAYLGEVQEIEKRNVTQKTVATTYGGLVGKLLDDTTEVLPGYTPVVEPKPVPVVVNDVLPEPPSPDLVAVAPVLPQVSAPAPSSPSREEVERLIEARVRELLAASVATSQNSSSSSSSTSGDTSSTGSTSDSNSSSSNADTVSPVITLSGNNPSRIYVGDTYSDLGASVSDNVNTNLGYKISVDGGTEVDPSSLSLNTSSPIVYTLSFSATDQAGNTGTATRTVIVEINPNGTTQTGTAPETETSSASTTPTSTEEATTTPTS